VLQPLAAWGSSAASSSALHFAAHSDRSRSRAAPDRMRPCDTRRRAELLDRATLVLNRSWRPVHVTTVRRALCMVFRDAARIVSPETLETFTFVQWLDVPVPNDDLAIRSPSVRVSAPEVIVLVHYDRVPCHEAPFTRRNLFLRDDFTCQYCGRRCSSDHLSVDHVLPRSRGGSTTWENCVLACVGCNARKADRTVQGRSHGEGSRPAPAARSCAPTMDAVPQSASEPTNGILGAFRARTEAPPREQSVRST